tara:strand:- start:1329 stop:1781 length:453 start_codon:yes stop_codon:yes gene_type:complete
MAEVEYKGIKIGGSKLLLILPLLGTLIGGLWGGFELYNRLLIAEKKLNNLNPAAIQAEVARLESMYDVLEGSMRADIDLALKEAEEARDYARDIDKTSADTNRDIRKDMYAMEQEMQKRFREMDADIRDNKAELEDKIQTVLENPLNDVE